MNDNLDGLAQKKKNSANYYIFHLWRCFEGIRVIFFFFLTLEHKSINCPRLLSSRRSYLFRYLQETDDALFTISSPPSVSARLAPLSSPSPTPRHPQPSSLTPKPPCENTVKKAPQILTQTHFQINTAAMIMLIISNIHPDRGGFVLVSEFWI